MLSQDWNMTAQVLRMANSIYYGYSRRIAIVTDAIVLIGLKTVRRIIPAASVSKILKRELSGYVIQPFLKCLLRSISASFFYFLKRKRAVKCLKISAW
ncbi:MAG: HDOD domain-containing protein [Bacillota bacterium]